MNILLAYSTKHFVPSSNQRVGTGMSASSAATLARTLYDTLTQYGQVDYVDGIRPPRQLPRKHYDLLVGIQGSITPLHRLAAFDKTILFAVNMHPVERNRILHDFNVEYSVCPAKHVARNTVHLEQLDDIRLADSIFLVGNATVARSFLKHGKSLEQIRRFNYASALPARAPGELTHSSHPRRILYVSTEMCLRKGFDILAELLRENKDSAIQVGIIGGAGDKTYRARLEELRRIMGEKLTVHGWVDSSSDAYLQLLRSYDAVIFPSLEEGQAGSVLDAMSQGLVPLITRETGIDYSPLGFLQPAMNCKNNHELLHRLINLSSDALLRLQQQTLQYYQAQHAGWETPLRHAFDLFITSGNPWPLPPENYTLNTTALSIPGNIIYDLTDQMERNNNISCVATTCTADVPRISWCYVNELPEGAIVLSSIRATPEPPFLLGREDSDKGVDTLSAPIQQHVIQSKFFHRLLTPLMLMLSILHPSKSKRKIFYNRWRLFKLPTSYSAHISTPV